MSKRSNTIWFILGATVFNILVTVLCFVLFLLLYGYLLAPRLPPNLAAWGLPVIFIGSIALSFLIYRLVLKVFMKRVNMEKYFDPIFGPRRRPWDS
jgi:hypothetical protein